MKFCNYKDLKVWQKSMDLTIEIYDLIKYLPKAEAFIIADQMKRAAISVPSNIAEGHGRSTNKDFIKFLSISRGSLLELETQTELCLRLGYINNAQSESLNCKIEEICKMINGLIDFRSSL